MDTTTTEPTPQPTAPSKPPKPPRVPRKYCPGFLVVGCSPLDHSDYLERFREAREWKEKAYQANRKSGAVLPPARPPLTFEQWADRRRPAPLRSEPYQVHAAALACAELAKRCGFLRVEVIEVTPERWEAEHGA